MYQQPLQPMAIMPQFGYMPDFGASSDRGAHSALCNPETTLWMGDLKGEWDADFIKKAFKHYSIEVANVKMLNDKFGSKASFCFVEFSSPDLARNAMLTLCGRTIPDDPDKSRFNLSFANSPNEYKAVEYNLFVANLSSSVDDVALYRVFGERYTSCRGAKVYRNADGSSREFGFVRFTDETDQQRALLEMNKHKLNNKEMMLKLAQPKDRRYRGGPLDRQRSGRNAGGYDADRRGSSRYDRDRGGDRRPHHNGGGLVNGSVVGAAAYGSMYGGAGVPLIAAPIPQPMPAQFVAMAPNHGLAGFGAIPVQGGYGGPPAAFMQGGVMAPQQYMMTTPIQYSAGVAPMQYPNGAPVMGAADPRMMNPAGYTAPATMVPNHVVSTQPQPIFIEGDQPLTVEEHNRLMMEYSGDFMATLESSRWNRVALTMDMRTKDLTTVLYNV